MSEEEESVMCDCQHCGVTFEQPGETHRWYLYCPYCGERVLPYYIDPEKEE